MFDDKIKDKINKLPDSSGVYFFVGKGREILYIGKATSIKNRVKSYFSKDIAEKRSPLIAKMVEEVEDIKIEKTDSVLEALIQEAELIKKHQPKYNTAEKDQKSWNYVVITNEDFPRVLVMREREISIMQNTLYISHAFGPYTNGAQLKEALKIMRKIFPFRDRCKPSAYKPCFNYQIGLCPGVCINKITKQEYKKTIHNIQLFFESKKKKIVKNLEKEMKVLAKNKEFEKAEKVKRQIFALGHINDVSLIRDSRLTPSDSMRIEAYDVAHISGTNMVGVMVVLENGEINKREYRMFKIKNQKRADDIKALGEVLERRFKHNEWQMPNLVVVDGGVAQINIAEKILKELKIEIPVVSVVKDERHKPRQVLGAKNEALKLEKEIMLANSEAHRFAINFHRKLRGQMLT